VKCEEGKEAKRQDGKEAITVLPLYRPETEFLIFKTKGRCNIDVLASPYFH